MQLLLSFGGCKVLQKICTKSWHHFLQLERLWWPEKKQTCAKNHLVLRETINQCWESKQACVCFYSINDAKQASCLVFFKKLRIERAKRAHCFGANPQNITVTWIIFKNWTRDMKPDLRMQQSSAKKEWVSACFSAAFIDEILRRNCKKHCSIKQHSLK